MTKFEIEVEEFKKAFPNTNMKIALYGTGRFTATLLQYAKDYHFVGLLDRDSALVGTELYGLNVLSRAEAEEQADIIVINTQESYWKSIYERVKDWNIAIYYRNGQKATLDTYRDYEQNPYWQKSLKTLEDKILSYQIISFDIFDTLLMRKIFYEIDVLKFTELKIKARFNIDFDFVSIRKQAASALEEPSIDEIYNQMRSLTSLSDDMLEQIKQCEIQTDLSLTCPRRDIIALCKKAQKTKDVYFVSDMYYPKEVLQQFLKKAGIATFSYHFKL